MASCQATPLQQFLHKHMPSLYSVCRGGNFHSRLDKTCHCCVGENGQGVYVKYHGKWIPREATDG